VSGGALAIIIWDQMARADGADEADARREEPRTTWC